MNRRHNEPKSSKDSLSKDDKNVKTFSQNDSVIYTFPIGKHIIDIPKSFTSIVSSFVKEGSLPSLNVSRVWIEKKGTEYVLHIGDLDDIPFD
jgi:hypothetical protein